MGGEKSSGIQNREMTTQTILREGIPADWKYIESLRIKESNSLGFIPKNSYISVLGKTSDKGRDRWKYARINVVEDNGDLTGFCYATFFREIAHIYQIVVQEDARRWYRATLLEDAVREDAKKYKCCGIVCRVAFDLESNFFWKAMGYIPMKEITSTWLNQKESKSKRPLWLYYLPLDGVVPEEITKYDLLKYRRNKRNFYEPEQSDLLRERT